MSTTEDIPANVSVSSVTNEENDQMTSAEVSSSLAENSEREETKPLAATSPDRVENVAEEEKTTPPQPPTPASPDSNCPICLGKMENKSFTNSCFHQFCFTCLLEWSKVKPQCPLCKQPFKSIVHSVRSMEDYDQYHLSLESVPTHSSTSRRYTSTRSWYLGEQYRRHLSRRRYRTRSTANSNTSGDQYLIPSRFVSDYRRHIYEFNHWVRPVSRNEGVRRTDTAFYAANQAMSHRLVPWLNRELNALGVGSRVAFIIEIIISMLERYHILSPEFAEHVRPFTGLYTRHFVHEFYHFARSPLDMVNYDRNAVYPTTVEMPLPLTNTDLSSDDSDLEVLDVINNDTSARDGRPRWSLSRVEVESRALNRTRQFLQLIHDQSINGEVRASPQVTQSIALSPQPGPSGLSNIIQIESVSNENQLRDSVIKCESAPSTNANDDNDIIVLDPPQRKSPEIINLSDEESSHSQPGPSSHSSTACSRRHKYKKSIRAILSDTDSSQPGTSTRSSIFGRRHVSKTVTRGMISDTDSDFETSSKSSSSSSTSSVNEKPNRIKVKRTKHKKSKSSHESKTKTISEVDENDASDRSHKKHKHKKSTHRHKSKKSKKEKRLKL